MTQFEATGSWVAKLVHKVSTDRSCWTPSVQALVPTPQITCCPFQALHIPRYPPRPPCRPNVQPRAVFTVLTEQVFSADIWKLKCGQCVHTTHEPINGVNVHT